ncbi:hypothetical protein [Nitratireductor sp. GCM10026969]|uniref:hypothetical protein n=1 Tax=Nitratireductor sp. GCM10026969 TaxID=3252645 RepID=UPI003612F6BA
MHDEASFAQMLASFIVAASVGKEASKSQLGHGTFERDFCAEPPWQMEFNQ